MKRPREILFRRHQGAVPKLDAVRQRALACLNKTHEAVGARPRAGMLWPFLLSLRWHLAGMAGVWLLAASLNSNAGASAPPAFAQELTSAHGQLLVALRENRRQLAEILEDPASQEQGLPLADPQRGPRGSGRRGEIQTATAVV